MEYISEMKKMMYSIVTNEQVINFVNNQVVNAIVFQKSVQESMVKALRQMKYKCGIFYDLMSMLEDVYFEKEMESKGFELSGDSKIAEYYIEVDEIDSDVYEFCGIKGDCFGDKCEYDKCVSPFVSG